MTACKVVLRCVASRDAATVTVQVMRALATAVVAALLLTLLAGCDASTAEQATRQPRRPLSDVPPPLVPAMALPDNAVDNAVAKLDGIAEELMSNSGIPGHGGGGGARRKDRVRQGFRRQGCQARRGEQGRPRHGVPAGVAVQAAGRHGGRPSGRRERDRLGHPDRVQAAVVRAVGSGGHPDGHRRRHVLAPVRACPTTPATCSRTSATTAATCWSGCASCRWTRSESPTPTPTSG